ncbi:MAG: FmdB family zinc ribbon protein [Planctomycetota bacterium]
MPHYDYKCKACGHTFEAWQKITAGARKKCPACGRLALRRLVGPGAGLIFRGTGFYQTDYASSDGSRKPKAAPDKDPGSPKPGGGESPSAGKKKKAGKETKGD